MGKFCQYFDRVICLQHISFLDYNFCEYQWIFTKLGMCIDIVEICFGIANGQISSIFDSYLPGTCGVLSFHVLMKREEYFPLKCAHSYILK